MGYIRCWTCVGNGVTPVVNHNKPWGSEVCPDCKGTGRDEKKTREYNKRGGDEQFFLTEITEDQLKFII
jgi:DnaJ-class molecular chaperone